MLDTLSQDYVRTARAKGLTRNKVVFRHAFRNALLPIITSVTLEIAFLFSGAIATETIFSWPGMGRLFYDGLNNRDYFLLMGIVFIGSLFVVVMTIVADVIYAIADPPDPVLGTRWAWTPRKATAVVSDLIENRASQATRSRAWRCSPLRSRKAARPTTRSRSSRSASGSWRDDDFCDIDSRWLASSCLLPWRSSRRSVRS